VLAQERAQVAWHLVLPGQVVVSFQRVGEGEGVAAVGQVRSGEEVEQVAAGVEVPGLAAGMCSCGVADVVPVVAAEFDGGERFAPAAVVDRAALRVKVIGQLADGVEDVWVGAGCCGEVDADVVAPGTQFGGGDGVAGNISRQHECAWDVDGEVVEVASPDGHEPYYPIRPKVLR
jgi:hypothetical protein